jgi:predicted dehydrogenase
MNILIVGLGSIALKHIHAIKRLKIPAKIFALRSQNNENNYSDIINIYDLDSCNIDFNFAIISNPTYLHFQYIELLIKKGINVFIEKPPVSTLQNFEELLDITENSNLVNYVACNLRFHPCLKFLKNELQNSRKRINEVNVYCGSYLPDWRPNKNFREIYSTKPEMGGGVHLDLYHELDFTTWIFGLPRNSRSILRNVSSLNIEAIDYANYLLEYESFSANIVLNYYRKDPKRLIEIVFDDDTWTLDLINNSLKTLEGKELIEISEFEFYDTYYYQMEYFINMLNSNTLPMNSLRESYEVLKICLQNE